MVQKLSCFLEGICIFCTPLLKIGVFRDKSNFQYGSYSTAIYNALRLIGGERFGYMLYSGTKERSQDPE